MELYIEHSEFTPGHPLHWDLPVRQGPHGRRHVGQLITIGRSSERLAPGQPAGDIEEFCDAPEQVIEVIERFSNLTALYINSHAGRDDRSRELERAGRRRLDLGGARIYAEHLPLFRRIRSCFVRNNPFSYTRPEEAELIYDPNRTNIPPDRYVLNDQIYSFQPRIVLCGCAIAQDREFCQGLANETGTYVFGATITQFANRTPIPWTLDGPILVFFPSNLFIPGESSIQDLSPFQQRLGQQRMATGSGRGVGRRWGPIGLA